jgi:hypothetical protein
MSRRKTVNSNEFELALIGASIFLHITDVWRNAGDDIE